jgi:hypothetical protein
MTTYKSSMERPIKYKERDVVKKYITFELVNIKPKTTEWFVINNKSRYLLASIGWLSTWRQYIVEFEEGTIFNDGCLRDVIEFLQELNKKQKANRENA